MGGVERRTVAGDSGLNSHPPKTPVANMETRRPASAKGRAFSLRLACNPTNSSTRRLYLPQIKSGRIDGANLQEIAAQIFTQGVMTKMTVRHMQGEPMERTLAWAESEVEGFFRT